MTQHGPHYTEEQLFSAYSSDGHPIHPGPSSGSPDALNINGSPVLKGIHHDAIENCMSTLHHGPSKTLVEELQTHGNYPYYLPATQEPAQYPHGLAQYFFDRSEPWSEVKASAGCTSQALGEGIPGERPQLRLLPFHQNFALYRDNATPSECDTVGPGAPKSDSGYGSLAKQSVGTSSMYGDTDNYGDTQSLIPTLSEFQLQTKLSPGNTPSPFAEKDYQRQEWNQQSVATATPPDLDSKSFNCGYCPELFRTKSELNKHRLRHERPFLCTAPGCKRTQGFGTANDLERHVHSIHRTNGVRYRCREAQCKSKNKLWPRADNFRQHLRKVHNSSIEAEESLEPYTVRVSTPEEPVGFDSTQVSAPQIAMDIEANAIEANARYQPPWAGSEQEQTPHSDFSYGSPSEALIEYPYQDYPIQHMDDAYLQNLGPLPIMPDFSQPQDLTDNVTLDSISGIYPSDGNIDQMLSYRDLPEVPQQGADPTFAGQTTLGYQYSCPDLLSHAGMGTAVSAQQPETEDDGSQFLELRIDDSPEYYQEEEQQVRQEDVQQEDEQDASKQLDRRANTMELGGEVPAGHDPEDADAEGDSDDGGQETVPPPPVSKPDCDAEGSITVKVLDDPPSTKLTLPATTPANLKLDSDADPSFLIKALVGRGVPDHVLKTVKMYIGYEQSEDEKPRGEKRKRPDDKSEDVPKCVDGRTDEPQVPCQLCPKKFLRRCELRKHLKRHEKPYACTYKDCDKRFGSKNDWKRHENSQHFQHDMWRCNEKLPPFAQYECGHVCYRRETFRAHLETDHGIQDVAVIEKKWNDCRIGRNNDSQFWCGFCEQVIECKNRGELGWGERYDHIDEHFSGKGTLPRKDISEWKHVDRNSYSAELGLTEEEEEQADDDAAVAERLLAATATLDVVASSGGHPTLTKPGGKGAMAYDSDQEIVAAAPPRAKRVKRKNNSSSSSSSSNDVWGQREVFWSCCACGNHWCPEMTSTCMDDNCGHSRCEQCMQESHKITEQPVFLSLF
ncbi:hypothetical protein QBC46DRAFT_403012 [Diplogelasinospora grovesii]|uniref:C2H2-type domain-containing protein n=1 Tax=Diplogelasinospora grovesii TaxID=303347 RepID=A0AAN6NIU4_9PEZI|nr:hypothetical protein QBC46DRAFT_403012 [Diplogelasinospora grovesii]